MIYNPALIEKSLPVFRSNPFRIINAGYFLLIISYITSIISNRTWEVVINIGINADNI